MIASRSSAFILAAIGGFIVLQPSCAAAQWWHRTPTDFEECADAAEKSASKEERTAALAECNAKFAGRRKPGGGYTYYDFMQDRSFDIAGPNPTPEEQKRIDEQYTVYLEKQRRNSIAAAFAAKQQQQQMQLQQASLRTESPARVPVPHERPTKAQMAAAQAAAANGERARLRAVNCAKSSFSCEWPRLSESLNDLKKLFVSPSGKAKKS